MASSLVDNESRSVFFYLDQDTIHQAIFINLEVFKKTVCELWIPKSILFQRNKIKFDFHKNAICAVDFALIEIRTPQNKELWKSCWSAKHQTQGYKVQTLVTPNKVCVHFTQLIPGSIHNKKIFDTSGLPELLTYCHLLPSGRVVQKRYHCIFNLGYLGVNHYYS
jgi:hypothetical protein